ncbi:hypothetical protein ACFE04_014774 [Oxalis oulophora]
MDLNLNNNNNHNNKMITTRGRAAPPSWFTIVSARNNIRSSGKEIWGRFVETRGLKRNKYNELLAPGPDPVADYVGVYVGGADPIADCVGVCVGGADPVADYAGPATSSESEEERTTAMPVTAGGKHFGSARHEAKARDM